MPRSGGGAAVWLVKLRGGLSGVTGFGVESDWKLVGEGDADVPNNLNTVGSKDVMLRVRTADGADAANRNFWVWAAIDNLKFAALNAIACAQELCKLRPQGKVQ